MKINQRLKLQFKEETFKSTRDGVSEGLMALGRDNQNVIVLTADLPDSTRTIDFSKTYPDRFFNVGVAEQNMAGIAAGLALSGKIPYIASFGVFSPGRNWDQIRVSIAYSMANVKILSSHTGLGTGEDGASHQALEDIALMRVLPNMTVVSPGDAEEASKAVIAAASVNGPVYIRYGRQAARSFTTKASPFSIGKAYVYVKGTDITILTTGVTLQSAWDAALLLEKKGISAELIHVPTVKPLDIDTILTSVRKTGRAVSIEDHQIAGGFGSTILENIITAYPVPFAMVGMHDSFGQSGPYKELFDFYHINAAAIVDKALRLMRRHRK